MSFTTATARRADFAEIAPVIAATLVDEPIYIDFIGARPDRLEPLRRFMLAYLRSTPERRLVVDLARAEDGAVIAAVVWERSAVGRDSALLAQLPYAIPFLRALGLRGVVRGLRVQHLLERFRPAEPHWYLMVSAGPADAVAALLRDRATELDELGAGAYVECTNDRDRALYGEQGFIIGATIVGLPTARPIGMFRTPRRRARKTV
jgi:hypothetical protein